jgi:hypothetical protein
MGATALVSLAQKYGKGCRSTDGKLCVSRTQAARTRSLAVAGSVLIP